MNKRQTALILLGLLLLSLPSLLCGAALVVQDAAFTEFAVLTFVGSVFVVLLAGLLLERRSNRPYLPRG